MSIFDGIGSALGAVFGAEATITRKSGAVEIVSGAIFRRVNVDDDTADGRALLVEVPTLQIPADACAPLQRGDMVQHPDAPGVIFRVLDGSAPESGAADGLATYRLEPR